MQSKILKSDFLYEYKAVGHDGKTMWKYAIPFKSAIEREPSLGKEIADMLANPASRENKDGKLDWFIPFQPENGVEYNIRTWNELSVQEKKDVRSKVLRFQNKLLLSAENWAGKATTKNSILFSHFLNGNGDTSIQFPGFDCLYLVDGKPVITFWGFIKKDTEINKKIEGIVNQEEDVQNISANINNDINHSFSKQTQISPINNHSICKHWMCIIGSLLLIPVLLLLLYLLWWTLKGVPSGCHPFTVFPKILEFSLEPNRICKIDFSGNTPSMDLSLLKDDLDLSKINNNQDPVITLDNETNIDRQGTIRGVAPTPTQNLSNNQKSELNSELSEERVTSNGEVVVPPELDNSTNTPNDTSTNTPIKPIDLSSKDGGLTGHYLAKSGIVDKNDSKPVKVNYDFNNGNGQVTLTRSDGIKCVGETSGFVKNGALSIDGTNPVKCPDGTIYEMPNVNCKKNLDGKTICGGLYGNRVDSGDLYMELYEEGEK
ncbi:MAG: hypothetical protein ACI4V7_08725 [Succinivibrionaceae bacterium]